MIKEEQDLEPFNNEDDLKPLSHKSNGSTGFSDNDMVPTMDDPETDEIKNKDSNFIFFFGTSGSGKSVILSSMLYYFRAKAGVLRPKKGTPNTKEAKALLSGFFDKIKQGILPERTTRDQVTRIDYVFEPNNKSKKVPPINLTFLETSGENHNAIKAGGSYHGSIEAYLEGKVSLTFIIVTSYDTAHKDDTIINDFFDLLEDKGESFQSVNAIMVISKWDKSGKMKIGSEEILDDFIAQKLPMTSQRLDTYRIPKTYYTIGNVEKTDNGEEKITRLSWNCAGILSKWLYRSIVGYDLDYEGTFWERIKFSFSNNG